MHMKVYTEASPRSWDKYFAGYGNTLLNLWMLVTHPDFRRRGAGTMVCNWGQTEAIKNGSILIVMASPMEKSLPEHLGYKIVGAEMLQADGEEETFDLYILGKIKFD
jgi:ribosomal protein S18 acetylase RimI-like enzyme